MAQAGFWVAWGLPTQGRERQALDLFNEQGLLGPPDAGRADRALRHSDPQAADHRAGGFVLIQGTQEQIDSLRRDNDFQRRVTQVQLVADRVGIVDAWVNQGLDEATDLYEQALRKAGLTH